MTKVSRSVEQKIAEIIDRSSTEGHAFCVVCLHQEREAIERDFINARGKYGAVTAIMRKYGIKHSASLYEHARATGLDAIPLRV